MNVERALAPLFARLDDGAARGRGAEIDAYPAHRAGDRERARGRSGNETMTSPLKVVWTASSPAPQNAVCSPSVKIISILSAESWPPRLRSRPP